RQTRKKKSSLYCHACVSCVATRPVLGRMTTTEPRAGAAASAATRTSFSPLGTLDTEAPCTFSILASRAADGTVPGGGATPYTLASRGDSGRADRSLASPHAAPGPADPRHARYRQAQRRRAGAPRLPVEPRARSAGIRDDARGRPRWLV